MNTDNSTDNTQDYNAMTKQDLIIELIRCKWDLTTLRQEKALMRIDHIRELADLQIENKRLKHLTDRLSK